MAATRPSRPCCHWRRPTACHPARHPPALPWRWYFLVGRAEEEARADAPRELLEQRARELGVVVHNQHVGDPVTGAESQLEDYPGCVRRRVGRARWRHRMLVS